MPDNILPFKGIKPTIHDSVFVAPDAYVIGDVEIGANCGIWFNVIIRGDVNEVRIGERVNIQDGTVVHVTGGGNGTYIGNDITIGHMALLHACTLEDGCFVGMKACVMDGVVVEKGAMVAAGALVTPGKRVKSGELWAGAPAKKIRDLTEKDYKEMKRNPADYVNHAQDYLNEGIGSVE